MTWPKASGFASSGVISLNKIPGLGKSGISRMLSRMMDMGKLRDGKGWWKL